MKNNYGLPGDALDLIFKRDEVCVYCKKNMADHHANNPRADWYTIEHLNYLPPWSNPATVVMCCWGCNSSRGNKKLEDWFMTDYCLTRNIALNTVTETVREYIYNIERKEIL